jgi:hypothetical protein
MGKSPGVLGMFMGHKSYGGGLIAEWEMILDLKCLVCGVREVLAEFDE